MKRCICALLCFALYSVGFVACTTADADTVIDTVPPPDIENTPIPFDPLQRDSDLSKFKKFAEAYEPRSGREVIPSPPVPSQEILLTISRLVSSQSRDHEKYVVLIFLRLSRFQLEHFKQRYELGRDNPLTKEFYRLIGREGSIRSEFMPASLADQYVEANPSLLKYPPIEVEMMRIEKAGQEIRKSIAN